MSYTKTITPNFENVRRSKHITHKKLTGYIGELRDGEMLVHSMEYSTYSQAEAALDELAFELLSDLAEQGLVDELPAFEPTTCVYCHKPHTAQQCPEMRVMLFAPDKPDTFKQAQKAWADHDCESESDVCTCQFVFNCTKCGKKQTVSGEEMPQYIDIGGKCDACYYNIAPRCVTCGNDGDCPDCDAIFVSLPLDVEFAPFGPQV